MKTKENAVTAEEILLDHVNVYNGMIESVPIQIINAMIKYSASQNTDLVKEVDRLKMELSEVKDAAISNYIQVKKLQDHNWLFKETIDNYKQQLSEKEKEDRVLKDQNNDFIIALNDYSDEVKTLQSKANKLAEALELIKEYQMDYVQLARTTQIYLLADKALSEFKGKETNG